MSSFNNAQFLGTMDALSSETNSLYTYPTTLMKEGIRVSIIVKEDNSVTTSYFLSALKGELPQDLSGYVVPRDYATTSLYWKIHDEDTLRESPLGYGITPEEFAILDQLKNITIIQA